MSDDEIASELDKLNGKMIELLVEGMITLKISFNELKYELVHDILKIYDEDTNYFTLNINEIIRFYHHNILKIITDNDLIILLKEKNAY